MSAVKAALDQAAPETELAVIDGSPGIGCPVIASVSGADLVLIVAEPSRSGISDLQRIVKTTSIFGAKTAVCVNRFDTSPENTEAIEAFCKEEKVPFVGRVPYDSHAAAAINAGQSLADVDCPARTRCAGFLKIRWSFCADSLPQPANKCGGPLEEAHD